MFCTVGSIIVLLMYSSNEYYDETIFLAFRNCIYLLWSSILNEC